MRKHLLFYLVILIISSSCRTVRILPDQPVTGNLPERPQRLPSEISVPLEIDISSVESLINAKLPYGRIASEEKRENSEFSFRYEVYRNRPVNLSAQGDELIFRIPIDIRARGTYTKCLGSWYNGRCYTVKKRVFSSSLLGIKPQEVRIPGATITEHADASPSVDVELRIKLEMRGDYSIKTKTYLRGTLSGDTHLHMDLFGDLFRINIDVSDKLEKPLQKFVQKYQNEIDERITALVDDYDLKTKVAQYWRELENPLPLDDLWLKIQPQKVLFENLNGQSDKLRAALGITAKLEIVNEKPMTPYRPLPNLTFNHNMQGFFNVYLPASVDFEFLEKKVLLEVIGKEYKYDKATVEILDLDMQGVRLNNVSAILIKVYVEGKYKFIRFGGDLYFTAIPSIDDGLKTISISDFSMEANTNNFLIDAALPFLVNKFYYEEIKEELTYSYQQEYDKFTELINNELEEIDLGQLTISGELEEITIPGLYIDAQSLEVLFLAKGLLNSGMNDGKRRPMPAKTSVYNSPPARSKSSNPASGYASGVPFKTMKDGKRWTTENLNINVDNSWCYDWDESNCDQYGRLYTWNAAKEACSQLGRGWRLPSAEDWKKLAKTYGGYVESYKAIHKYKGRPGRGKARFRTWANRFGDSKTSYEALKKYGDSGFDALLGGYRSDYGEGDYFGLDKKGFYWSNTGRYFDGYTHGISILFQENTGGMEIDIESLDRKPSRSGLSSAYSCRCVKD